MLFAHHNGDIISRKETIRKLKENGIVQEEVEVEMKEMDKEKTNI